MPIDNENKFYIFDSEINLLLIPTITENNEGKQGESEMTPKIRLTRKEKRIIRKANTMIIEKANMNPVASIPIAYALTHGYVVIEEENDNEWVLTKEVKARSKEVKKTEAEE